MGAAATTCRRGRLMLLSWSVGWAKRAGERWPTDLDFSLEPMARLACEVALRTGRRICWLVRPSPRRSSNALRICRKREPTSMAAKAAMKRRTHEAASLRNSVILRQKWLAELRGAPAALFYAVQPPCAFCPTSGHAVPGLPRA